MRKATDDGGDTDVCHHLEGKCRAENGTGVRSRKVVGQKRERNCREARARQGDPLSGKESAIGAVLERRRHAEEVTAFAPPAVAKTAGDRASDASSGTTVDSHAGSIHAGRYPH